jgi:hypothetical protein
MLVGLGVTFLMCIRFEHIDMSLAVKRNFFQFLSGRGRLSNIVNTKIVLYSS